MKTSYESELNRVVEEWQKETISDEWLFAQFRESYVSTMEPYQAFEALDITIKCLLNVEDEDALVELVQTMIDLARRSNTTEIPRLLATRKDEIEKKIKKCGNYAKDKTKEFFRHYRMID